MNRLVRAAPQIGALALVLFANWLAFPSFFDLAFQNGRAYGPLIDVLNRGAPVMLLAVGMTLVIATKGVDLSVGAVMAISGAVAATLTVQGYPLAIVLLASLGVGLVCGLWNGFLVAVLDIQPIIATLILMVAGRGVAQLITSAPSSPSMIRCSSSSAAAPSSACPCLWSSRSSSRSSPF